MSVNNPNRSSLKIDSRDPAQTESGFVEIVSDDFAFLHRELLLLAVQNRLRRKVKVEGRSEHGGGTLHGYISSPVHGGSHRARRNTSVIAHFFSGDIWALAAVFRDRRLGQRRILSV